MFAPAIPSLISDQILHLSGERIYLEGLGQHMHATTQLPMVRYCVLWLAGVEQHLEIWPGDPSSLSGYEPMVWG
jgi:hypothetical protein